MGDCPAFLKSVYMERLDSRTRYESDMEEYLSEYGRHFNKRLFEYAVSMMEDRNKKKLNAWSKDQCDNFLRDNGVSVKNAMGYDSAYVLNMARSDYFGSSIVEDARLALYVRDYMDDVDGNPTRAFDEFYINCVAKGVPIFWGDML